MGLLLSSGLMAAAKMLFDKAKRQKAQYEAAVAERKIESALVNSYREQVAKMADEYAKQQEALQNLRAGISKAGDHTDVFPEMVFGGDLRIYPEVVKRGSGSEVAEAALFMAKGIDGRGKFRLTLQNMSDYHYKVANIMVDDITMPATKRSTLELATASLPLVKVVCNYIYGKVEEVVNKIYVEWLGFNIKVGSYVGDYNKWYREVDIPAHEAVTIELNPASPFEWIVDGEKYTSAYPAYQAIKRNSGAEIEYSILCYFTIVGNNDLLEDGQWIPYLSKPLKGIMSKF